MELHAILHEEEASYWAEVKELPGCFASGFTLDELLEGLREATPLYLGPDAAADASSVRIDELRLVAARKRV